MVPEIETGSRFVQLLEQGITDEFYRIVRELRRVHGQPFISHMIMLILDLHLEGIVPIPSPDLITARINYCISKRNSLMDYLKNVRDHQSYQRTQLLYKKLRIISVNHSSWKQQP